MVTWIILKNHLLEADLTQNQETMALQTLTTNFFLYTSNVEQWRLRPLSTMKEGANIITKL